MQITEPLAEAQDTVVSEVRRIAESTRVRQVRRRGDQNVAIPRSTRPGSAALPPGVSVPVQPPGARRAEGAEQLKAFGADHVVVDVGQIRDSVLSLRPRGVDHAIEVVGAATLLDTARCVRPWGEVVVVGLLAGPPVLNEAPLIRRPAEEMGQRAA